TAYQQGDGSNAAQHQTHHGRLLVDILLPLIAVVHVAAAAFSVVGQTGEEAAQTGADFHRGLRIGRFNHEIIHLRAGAEQTADRIREYNDIIHGPLGIRILFRVNTYHSKGKAVYLQFLADGIGVIKEISGRPGSQDTNLVVIL